LLCPCIQAKLKLVIWLNSDITIPSNIPATSTHLLIFIVCSLMHAGCHSDNDCEGDSEFPEIDDLFDCCEETSSMGSFRDENGECFDLTGTVCG